MFNMKRIIVLMGFGGVLAAGTLAYFYYQELQIEKKAAQELALAKQKQLELQKKLSGAPGSHLAVHQMIEDLRVNGKTPPPCPLIYPLLNEKGRVTPLGSYLSYFAMVQAACLPEAVLNLPNPGSAFQNFKLFDAGPSQYQEQYHQQLPYFWGTQDCANGKLVRTKSGYRIVLQFKGSHPPQQFEKKFKAGQLHLAPSWMASCLQQWIGFQPNTNQTACLNTPVFLNDDDLKRGASLESLARQGGCQLVNRWDAILAKNPENAYLLERWIDILNAREGTNHLELIEPIAKKYPENPWIQLTYAQELYSLKKYDDVLKISMDELKMNDDNPDWYSYAVCALEAKRYYDEAIELLKNWVQKHPENPNALMQLAIHMRYWAWAARGSDWSKNVSPEGWKTFKDRIAEGLKSAQKATDLAPLYGRAWGGLMEYGNGADFDKVTMQGYFEKVLQLDPNDYNAYSTYMDYLEPKWNGSDEKMFDLAEKYKKRFPVLFTVPSTEKFQVYTEDQSEEGLAKWRRDQKKKIKNSPYWKDFADGCKNYLLVNPGDFGEWIAYLDWAKLRGNTQPVLDLAKKVSAQTKEWAGIYPYLVLADSDATQNGLSTYYDKKNFIKKPAVVKLRLRAYKSLLALDPDNWDIWNRLAYLQTQNKLNRDAKKTFQQIGNHWVAEVWPKDDFEEAKKNLGMN